MAISTIRLQYLQSVQDENSLCLCFKNMYRTLFVAIFTSTFIFSMSKSSHTYRNINISNLQSDSNQHNLTAVFTIHQQFLQSDCNLHNRTAIYTIRLQFRRIAVWLLRLQSDCWECKSSSTYSYMPQLSTRCQAPLFWLLRLQADCWDCILIFEVS